MEKRKFVRNPITWGVFLAITCGLLLNLSHLGASLFLMVIMLGGICSRDEKKVTQDMMEEHVPEVEEEAAELKRLPIETLEGIGSVHGKSLRNEGISTLEDLMTARADEIAAICDVDMDTAQRWIAMSRFCWMQTVSEEDAEAIVYAGGIMDIYELANADVNDLFSKVNKSVKMGHIQLPEGYEINKMKVQDWIDESNSLLKDYPQG